MIVRPALAYRSLALALGTALLCAGCSVIDGPILDPKGPITLAERDLLFQAVGIMMIVIIGLFWHFLDIIWVVIFSVVYLPGLL